MFRLPIRPALCLLLAGNSGVWAQFEASDDTGSDLLRSQALLFELEESHHQMDPRLAEPLLQLAEQFMVAGRFEEAHRHLDRGMQIVRINEGLFTRSQLPYLKRKIENHANRGNWDGARSQLQHLFWLYRAKTGRVDSILVDDLVHLSNMHLRGITEDGHDMQSYHFRRAASANWMALAVAEAIWGKNGKPLGPLLYGMVKQYHLQAVAVDRGGRTGHELRQVAPGSEWVRERADMRRYYYLTGMRLLNQLQSIYSDAEPPDMEGLAMANLYLADWQVLFGRHGESLQSYRQAYLALEQSGVASELIDKFFIRPSVLPEPHFHPSVEGALAARSDSFRRLDSALSFDNSNDFIYFAEWGSAFPYVNHPAEVARRQQPDSNFALFSFNLAGVSDIPLSIDNRNSTAFSEVQDARLVNTIVESPDQEERLLERLEWLKFRPRLLDGLPQEAEATLRYQLAGDFPD